MLEPDGRIASWNPGAARLTGYAESDALGRHFSMLYAPDRARTPALVLEAARRDGAFEEECWHVRQRRQPVLRRRHRLGDSRRRTARCRAISVVTRDVTQRIELQRQTERSRDFYFALFSDLPNLVWRSDGYRRMRLRQQRVDRLHRQGRRDATRGRLACQRASRRPRTLAGPVPALAEGAALPFELEARLARADGSYGILHLHGAAVPRNAGRGSRASCARATTSPRAARPRVH